MLRRYLIASANSELRDILQVVLPEATWATDFLLDSLMFGGMRNVEAAVFTIDVPLPIDPATVTSRVTLFTTDLDDATVWERAVQLRASAVVVVDEDNQPMIFETVGAQ